MKKVIKFLLSLVLMLSLFTSATYAIKIEPDETVVPIQTEEHLGTLISNGITVALSIAGLLTFAFLVWGGIQWITSGGDKAQYEAARNRITYALVGLAIVAAAWAVMKLIGNFFGIDPTEVLIPKFE